VAQNRFLKPFLGAELTPGERKLVLEELFVFGKENQRPFLMRMTVLIIVSTIIATGGLLSNSSAVVIGAMLVAPMMRPVMAAAAAITLGWAKRLYQSLVLVFWMTIGVVVISAGLTFLGPEMISVPGQVLARTEPTFFDLVIALAAGVGGAYVMTRKESNAIPGVAMAVSLLPPLASCGILIVFGEPSLAVKAFVLFVTNFLAMTLAGSVTFVFAGIVTSRSRKSSGAVRHGYTVVFIILVGAISIPLWYYSNAQWYGSHFRAAKSEILQTWLKKNNLGLEDVYIHDKKQILYLNLTGAKPPLSIESLHNALSKLREGKGEHREFTIKTRWIQTIKSSWPPPPNMTDEPAFLQEDHTIEDNPLINVIWQWEQTQYNTDEWVKSKNPENYIITFDGKNNVTGKVSCNTLKAKYQLSSNLFNILKISTTDTACKNPDLDAAFTGDLNRAINFEIIDNRLVLQLNDNAGLMYFDRMGGNR